MLLSASVNSISSISWPVYQFPPSGTSQATSSASKSPPLPSGSWK
jgi:hypothetical protein